MSPPKTIPPKTTVFNLTKFILYIHNMTLYKTVRRPCWGCTEASNVSNQSCIFLLLLPYALPSLHSVCPSQALATCTSPLLASPARHPSSFSRWPRRPPEPLSLSGAGSPLLPCPPPNHHRRSTQTPGPLPRPI